MKKITTFLIFSFFYQLSAAQRNDTQAGLYNIGLGSLTGGIGAMINKKPDEKLGKVFVKGLWQGALGGYAVFESKRMVRLIHKNNELGFAWPSKILNAAGTSIVENAAANRNLWEKWHINYGFSRIEIHVKDKFSVRYKVMPVALVYTVGIALQTKFELGQTLQTGHFIFSSNTKRWEETNSDAIAYPGNIVYKPGEPGFNNILSHEIIHLYQFNDVNGFNAYLDKPYSYLNKNSQSFTTVNKWVYLDVNNILQQYLYLLANKNRVYYYDNYFEHEAGYYSDTLEEFVPYTP